MKETRDFSVLMSVYSKEKPEYLERALRSITDDQDLLPSEIVLVEDGPLSNELYSTIAKYLSKYKDILKIVKLDENRGLGNALRIGLTHCTNEIVARMDSDDISLPWRFRVQYNFFIEHNFDVVGANILEFEGDENNVVGMRKVPELHDDIVAYSKRRNPMNHPAVMFKKGSVLNVGSYEEIKGFEDYYLWVKMIRNGCTFYNIQQPLLKFRTGREMIRRRGSFNYLSTEVSFFKMLREIRYINQSEYFKNVFIRTLFRILPSNFRLFLYRKFLRERA